MTVTVTPLARRAGRGDREGCAGEIDSLVELLQGKLSDGVMKVVTRQTGLFPAPPQIELKCSCPDWAAMCKHVAAVLYGVGARLDEEPELLFMLRGVDAWELVSRAAAGAITGSKAVAKEKVLSGDLASVFGIDLDMAVAPPAKAKRAPRNPLPQPLSSPPLPSPPRGGARGWGFREETAPVKAPAPVTITGAQLSEAGVPAATVQSWRKAGVLLPTEARGVYGRTPKLEERLARYRRG